jgi:ABC-type glycerol-3-phosphate transport system permease component
MSDDLEIPPTVPEAARRAAAGQPTAPQPGFRARRSLARTGAYLILVALALFAIVPFSWLVLASFDRQANVFVKVTIAWTLEMLVILFS